MFVVILDWSYLEETMREKLGWRESEDFVSAGGGGDLEWRGRVDEDAVSETRVRVI